MFILLFKSALVINFRFIENIIEKEQSYKQNMRHKLRKIDFVDEERSSIILKQKVTLDRLIKQNNNSKNLIDKLMEQGTGRTKFMISSQKELYELEEQLRKITIRLDMETKRNETLKDLVSILNNEDKKTKKQQLLEVNRVIDQREKKLKKQEYDIEQILQKHNQVIAKINVLKQQISCSRRERVVYSNLFKKIQKQIKVYEQSYKQILIEAREYEKKQKTICEEISLKRKIDKQIPLQNITSQDHDQVDDAHFKRSIDIESIVHQNSSPPSLPRRQLNASKTGAMMDSLNEYKLFFDILKSQTGQQSEMQIIRRLPLYCDENQELIQMIEQLDNRIIQQSDVLKSVCSQISQKDCVDDDKQTQQNSLSPSVVIEDQIQNKTHELAGLSQGLKQMCQLLNISEQQCQIQTIFQKIQNKLSSLNPQQFKPVIESETLINKKLADHETHIQSVIQKMDGYQESQKILSKHYLQNQCTKELYKHKRMTKSRK